MNGPLFPLMRCFLEKGNTLLVSKNRLTFVFGVQLDWLKSQSEKPQYVPIEISFNHNYVNQNERKEASET